MKKKQIAPLASQQSFNGSESGMSMYNETAITKRLKNAKIVQHFLSIRCTLTCLMVSQVLIASFLIWLISFSVNYKSSKLEIVQYMDSLSVRVEASIAEQLTRTKESTQMVVRDWNMKKINSLQDWKEHLWRTMDVYNISMASVGLDKSLYGKYQYYTWEDIPKPDGTFNRYWRQMWNESKALYSWKTDIVTGKDIGYDGVASFNIQTRTWFTDMMANATVNGVWGDVYITASSKSMVIVYSAPLFNVTTPTNNIHEASTHKRLGAAKSNLSLKFLNIFLQSIVLPKDSIIIVSESNGLLLSTSSPKVPYMNPDNTRLHTSNVTARSVDKITEYYRKHPSEIKSGAITIVTARDAKYVVTANKLQYDNIKWVVFIALRKNYVFKNLIRSTWISAIAGVCVAVAAVIIVAIGAYTVSKPLFNLSKKMEKLQRIELDGNEKYSESIISEVRNLQEHFGKMETAIYGFMKYVPAEVVRNFINQHKDGHLFEPGVVSKDIAVMFTDIVKFTTITEEILPETLVEMMTLYFETVSREIFNYSGTLDKYIGDATMSLFNCPGDVPDYEVVTCDCALQIQEEIAKLNGRFVSMGRPKLLTGIGIHVGPCYVGNVGSSFRLSYTALGDVVNATSRIEGLTRHYQSDILISGECYERVKKYFVCRLLDTVAVKGKSKAMQIYELVGSIGKVDEQTVQSVAEYNQIMAEYYRGNFQETMSQFELLQRKYSDLYMDDKAMKMILQRCRHNINNPPLAEWDGVEVLNSK